MFFFFSSRRRHTRFKCDWSSDVCSSDLQGRRRDGADRQRQGQEEALRYASRSAPKLEEGLRVPEAGPGNQLRGGGVSVQSRKFTRSFVAKSAAVLRCCASP